MVFTLHFQAQMVFHGVNMWEHKEIGEGQSHPLPKHWQSDHARYITRRIAQHARSMATGTQSLPTDSLVPYFQPIERGYMSEGWQEGVYAPPFLKPSEQMINIGGTDYHADISETDKVSTYTGLDDYDTLFAARHGRGALDPGPRMSEQIIMTTPMGITPPTVSMGLMVSPVERVMPTHVIIHSSQREQVSIPKDFATQSSFTQFWDNWGRCSYIYWYDRDYIECFRPTDSYGTWYTTIKRFVT